MSIVMSIECRSKVLTDTVPWMPFNTLPTLDLHSINVSIFLVHSIHVQMHIALDVLMGCSRKNPHPHDGWDSGNSPKRGGQRPWKSRRKGGLNLKKSAGVTSTDSSRDSNV